MQFLSAEQPHTAALAPSPRPSTDDLSVGLVGQTHTVSEVGSAGLSGQDDLVPIIHACTICSDQVVVLGRLPQTRTGPSPLSAGVRYPSDQVVALWRWHRSHQHPSERARLYEG